MRKNHPAPYWHVEQHYSSWKKLLHRHCLRCLRLIWCMISINKWDDTCFVWLQQASIPLQMVKFSIPNEPHHMASDNKHAIVISSCIWKSVPATFQFIHSFTHSIIHSLNQMYLTLHLLQQSWSTCIYYKNLYHFNS